MKIVNLVTDIPDLTEKFKVDEQGFKNLEDFFTVGWKSFHVACYSDISFKGIKFFCYNHYCHAGIKTLHEGIVDVFAWGKIAEKDRPVVSELLEFMVSPESPWYLDLPHLYVVKNKDGLILGTVSTEVSFEGALVYSNFLIAARQMFEFQDLIAKYVEYRAKGFSILSSFFLIKVGGTTHNPFSEYTYPTHLFDKTGLKYNKCELTNICNHIWYDEKEKPPPYRWNREHKIKGLIARLDQKKGEKNAKCA